MKYVVATYIQTMIDYGDYYFRQNTLETVPLAIQCYVLAGHIYGPRGQVIPKQGTTKTETYMSLLDKWDAFENAVVDLELAFPFSNQITTQLPPGWQATDDLPNIFGFATTHYFCLPDNPDLAALKDTIDDRLFKLRHCQDINGVVQQLALFSPPLYVGLLVQAAAQGLSISSVLSDLSSPLSNYRFFPLNQKALELCGELKALGTSYLSAREKDDVEKLAVLRAHHDTVISQLVMDVRMAQKEEASKSLDALNENRLSPVARLTYYLQLLGMDTGLVPDSNTDFQMLTPTIDAPTVDGGLALSPSEDLELTSASAASDFLQTIGIVETLASGLHAIPNITTDGKPWGIGLAVVWGPPFLADATSAVARGMRIHGDNLNFQSTQAGRKAGFQRQIQERYLQANMAGLEIKHLDKQILAQQSRIDIADKEITSQQQQINNNTEIETFLSTKYTNEQLYTWLSNQTQTLYYQTYTLAYDFAKRAELAYHFERPHDTTQYIEFGYWDPTRDGLLSGEQLMLGLKKMESAYQSTRGYDFEITKNISLRQVNPWALLQLRLTATCTFTLPEVLFDMDFPGHYNRRIKSVAVTIPCVAGPYTGVTATLQLLQHQYRTSAIAKDKNSYPVQPDELGSDTSRFATVQVPIDAIATSSCQNDAGVFELLFRDERFMPFEGAGVISQWQLSLPDAFRQFDYQTITDVIIHVHYTSVNGGDKHKVPATGALIDYISSVQDLSQHDGLFTAFDLRNEFSDAWYQATHPTSGATQRVMSLNGLDSLLPIYTKGFKKCVGTDIIIFSSTVLTAGDLHIVLQNPGAGGGGDPILLLQSDVVGNWNTYSANNISLAITSWQFIIADMTATMDQVWMLVRYTLN